MPKISPVETKQEKEKVSGGNCFARALVTNAGSFYESEATSGGSPQNLAHAGLQTASRSRNTRQYDMNSLQGNVLISTGSYDRPATTPCHTNPQTQDTQKEKTRRDPVVGHIGRLVPNDEGVSMFAGSSTGVHFISQAEQHMQKLRVYDHTFPTSIYGLHLRNIWRLSSRSVDSDLIAGITAQLPHDSIRIVEAAIDTWTPLYPAIHKPTALAAYERLLRNPADGNIVHLYHILLLLSLGTIGLPGDCVKPHQHVFCQSDTFYSLALTISGRVLTLHDMLTLQGLIFAQLYMQLSCRYADASHFGGVAARLAQTLGLHRHSARFKLDPLETELRRRAWWCQYSLDAFVARVPEQEGWGGKNDSVSR